MITEDQLAAAIVAKMAGSELAKVDSQTIQHSSSGPATKIDPKTFLTGLQKHQQNREQLMLDHAQRMAEQMAPLPSDLYNQGQVQQQITSQPQLQTSTERDPNQLTFDFLDEATQKKSLKQLDLIVDYLYSINNKLDKILNRDKHSVSK
jgi:hypothetical protein